MKRNLIVYKVDYVNTSEPYNYHTGKFVRTKRIIMTPDEVDQTDGYWRNHRNVEKKFAKQMMGIEDGYWDSKYRVMRVRKAKWKKLKHLNIGQLKHGQNICYG